MHETGSVLFTLIDRLQKLTDLSDGRYDYNFLLNDLLLPAFVEIFDEELNHGDKVIRLLHTINIKADTKHYILPPNIGQVEFLVKLDDAGRQLPIVEKIPRHQMHPCGPGWFLEGNEITFRPVPTEDTDFTLFYIPSGNVLFHFAGDGKVIGPDSNMVQLSAAPELGMVDRRENAYDGQLLRILQDGIPWQERIVESTDTTVEPAIVKARIPFTVLPAEDAAVTYEIAPFAHPSLMTAVAMSAAMSLGATEGYSVRKMQQLEHVALNARRVFFNQHIRIIGRLAKRFEPVTWANHLMNDSSAIVAFGTSGLGTSRIL